MIPVSNIQANKHASAYTLFHYFCGKFNSGGEKKKHLPFLHSNNPHFIFKSIK